MQSYAYLGNPVSPVPIVAGIFALLFTASIIIFTLWSIVDAIKRTNLNFVKKIIYLGLMILFLLMPTYALFFALTLIPVAGITAFIGTPLTAIMLLLICSGYFLNNKRTDWDPEKKKTRKFFWISILLFILGIVGAPLVVIAISYIRIFLL